jgi:RHS repeat-associated protein
MTTTGAAATLRAHIISTSRVFDYSYDVAGRLVVVEEDGAVSATYSYDDNGNRTDAVVDEQDRLLSHGTFTYGWDADGALVSRTDTSTNATMRFAYDTLGGLRQVTLSDGRVIDYVIDGLGRRIGKRVDGVLQQGFVYDGQLRIVAELDGSGVVRRRYVYSSHANVPDIAIDVLTGETWRIITDHLGSPRLVVDVDDGTIVAEREFDEFGRVVIDSAPGLLPFGFAGGLEDPDTGLVRFGARDYDPESGRWTAKDPIGFNGGDTNVYAYVAGDPVNRIDAQQAEPMAPDSAARAFRPASRSGPAGRWRRRRRPCRLAAATKTTRAGRCGDG